MESSKKRDFNQISEAKTLKRSSYNNRKECIKKKTMELATLCGINACTIIYGVDGEIESWPENPTAAKAIIKNFKDLTDNPYKRTTVRDESYKKVIDLHGGEDETCQENPTAAKANIKNFEDSTFNAYQRTTIRDKSQKKVFAVPDNLAKIEKSLLYLSQSSMTEYREDFLKQLDSKLEALTKRIEFLRKDQPYDTNSCCVENKQLYYSENTSPKRIKISQAPLFPFDLNYPPPDEAECSSLSSEDYHDVHNR